MALKVLLILLFHFLFQSCEGIVRRNIHVRRSNTTTKANDIQYQTLYFEQQVDHFGFSNQDTYQQRYLYADQFWDSSSGPIFFYTGNEGDITWFCNNTGLVWDWAPEFKALVVFAEHRYYGESQPYGKESFRDLTRTGYLTSEQALADFVRLVDHIKTTVPGADDKPVIAFGGSYGGMLSAWWRIKYPHVVAGALAGSAPIWMFGDLVPCEDFSKRVTDDFKRESETCAHNIRQSWDVISSLGKTKSGRENLTSTFFLCDALQTEDDVNSFKSWLVNVYTNLAMVDYPYAADFLASLPAWPIKEMCQPLASSEFGGTDLLEHLSQAIGVYYNYTGQAHCLSFHQDATLDIGEKGWDFQSCTEMVMPICSDGENDMFEPSPWDFDEFAKGCKKRWGVVPRPDWILQQYGGKHIATASNIIFSNGALDPWGVGGVLTTLTESLPALLLTEGAHHLDLRAANPNDPPDVIEVREKEKTYIQQWINDYFSDQSTKDNENVQFESVGADWSDFDSSPICWSDFFRGKKVGKSVKRGPEGVGDLTIIMGTLLFALGAGVLLFYLALSQNIHRYIKRKKCTTIDKKPLLHISANLDLPPKYADVVAPSGAIQLQNTNS